MEMQSGPDAEDAEIAEQARLAHERLQAKQPKVKGKKGQKFDSANYWLARNGSPAKAEGQPPAS